MADRLTVATVYFEPNEHTKRARRNNPFTPEHVHVLHHYFDLALHKPFEFIVFTDKPYPELAEFNVQPLEHLPARNHCELEPYRLAVPMIACGLDTCPVGNLDDVAEYLVNETKPVYALPRMEVGKKRFNVGVQFVSKGFAEKRCTELVNGFSWRGSAMPYMIEHATHAINDLFPHCVGSYRFEPHHPKRRIFYWHGPTQPQHFDWWKRRELPDFLRPA